MKKVCLISILLIMALVSRSQVMWQVTTSTTQKWFLSQADEFNAAELNKSMWKPLHNSLYNVDLGLFYKQENIEFNTGTVSLVCKKENYTHKITTTEEEKKSVQTNDKTNNVNNEYTFDYTGAFLLSSTTYTSGYFEMRFKTSGQKGIWPSFALIGGNKNEGVTLFDANAENADQAHIDIHCLNGCNETREMVSKKNWNGWTKLNESLAKDWNIVSGEWGADYIKFFVNGETVGYYKGAIKSGKKLVVSNSVSKKGKGLKSGPGSETQWPAKLEIDYVRVWSKEDTSGTVKDNYTIFENSLQTIDNRLLYSAEIKKKSKAIVNAKAVQADLGTITLLPVFYNKYSVSVQGTSLITMQIDVIDRFNEKVAGFALNNVQYYIMDLSALPTGPYKVKINVAGQLLEQDIPVINPEKVGEQRDPK